MNTVFAVGLACAYVYAYTVLRGSVERSERRILLALVQIEQQITKQGEIIMDALSGLQSEVEAENTVIDSAIVLLNGLSKEIADLKPTQEAIDALAAKVKGKASDLAAAVTTNTPAAP